MRLSALCIWQNRMGKVKNNNYVLSINVQAYCKAMALTAIALVSAHLVINIYNYQVDELPWLLIQLFELDEENNLPSWYSGFLLLNNAFVLYLIANTAEKNSRFHWFLLAGGFFFLSIDEIAGLHETFNSSIDTNWAIPAAFLVAGLGVSFIPFLRDLPKGLAKRFILAGVIYVSGVIIIELLSKDMESDSLAYAFAVAVEEGMEMLGALLFLWFNLSHMRSGENFTVEVHPE